MSYGELCLFALQASQPFGSKLAEAIKFPLSPHQERDFPDGEHKAWPLSSVRGRDVFVVQSTHADATHSVNDKLCRLLFFVGALRDAGARRITVVIPYLCYMRGDRKTEPRGPVTTAYVAKLLEAVGVESVLTLDVHNLTAYQNAFRCHKEHLEAHSLFVDYFMPLIGDSEVTVVSPDTGGIKRAERFGKKLESSIGRPVAMAFMEKRRGADTISGRLLSDDLRDRIALIFDDMITTGSTLARAASACRGAGAKRVYAAATHGLFVGEARALLNDAPIDHIAVTDTIPRETKENHLPQRVAVISVASLLGQAILQMHTDGSLVGLTE